jgi:hypothetical protein
LAAIVGSVAHDVAADGTIIVPAGSGIALANRRSPAVAQPVSGQDVVGDGPPFTPSWAE